MKLKKMLILSLVCFYPIYLLSISLILAFWGTETKGTIMKILSIEGKNGASINCLVQYTNLNGEVVQFEGRTKFEYFTGSKLPVLYLENTNFSRINDPWRIWGIPILLNIFFVWFFLNYNQLNVEEHVDRLLYGIKDDNKT